MGYHHAKLNKPIISAEEFYDHYMMRDDGGNKRKEPLSKAEIIWGLKKFAQIKHNEFKYSEKPENPQ